MPLFLTWMVEDRLFLLWHRVEVEVSSILVHSLHHLLSLVAYPLLHVDSQILALFSERHLVPLGFVKAIWTVRVLHSHRVIHRRHHLWILADLALAHQTTT